MVLIRDILFSLWGAFLAMVAFFQEKTVEANIDVWPPLIIAVVFLVTIWLASGCWAGSIAGARRHSIKTHFVLGLLVPYLYPAVCLFAMDIKGARERAEAQRRQLEAEEQEREMRERAAELERAEQLAAGLGEAQQVYDQEYFSDIMLDEDGSPTGPWVIGFGETVVHARRICEALANVVVVEIADNTGQTQRIRVPYAKITSCGPMD